jgi:hypothetical protein
VNEAEDHGRHFAYTRLSPLAMTPGLEQACALSGLHDGALARHGPWLTRLEAAGIEPAPDGAKLPAESRPYLVTARNDLESISRRVPCAGTGTGGRSGRRAVVRAAQLHIDHDRARVRLQLLQLGGSFRLAEATSEPSAQVLNSIAGMLDPPLARAGTIPARAKPTLPAGWGRVELPAT